MINWVNNNGEIVAVDSLSIGSENRAFKYGDGVFDTIKLKEATLLFLEDHYFRLMSSMRMMRMRIPMNFTLEFYEDQIRKTLEANDLNNDARIRVNVFRKDGGLYTPETNEVDFLIEVKELKNKSLGLVEVELYKDFPISSGLFSTIKTNNRMLNVLASIFSKENGFQNCLLINEKKELVEGINANVFLIKGQEVFTPALESGCINGIVRKKLITLLEKSENFQINQASISPFELLKADEVFLTNSIQDIISVDKYRKKTYKKQKTLEIQELFHNLSAK
ncbi:aminotransferase class IV [Lutimonas zeaxanthinifaciens]|uniref:aminotransferase class IV n=1 Tax=Lutimonas zeaxanthinifaciens TaxID=3060215 RepID=UPI00265D423C|nr:aminotransferase class IV [Lutimonas sp. YSD2104]WKK67451.1 aminotransferase class IV [Lutimonas sp. YSD2104]